MMYQLYQTNVPVGSWNQKTDFRVSSGEHQLKARRGFCFGKLLGGASKQTHCEFISVCLKSIKQTTAMLENIALKKYFNLEYRVQSLHEPRLFLLMIEFKNQKN